MKELSSILEGVEVTAVTGNPGIAVASVCFDSRRAAANDLFVATRGTVTDGHLFIGAALEKGVSAVVCEELPESPADGVCWIKVSDSSRALGIAASNYFDRPSASLRLTGVTGTNGKTTIATLLYRLVEQLGYKAGLLSTVANYIHLTEEAATHTTPDPVELNRLLRKMVEEGCDHAFMEVSSHAIDQKRIAGLKFEGGIFSNLTHDHLDYHLTFTNYLNAKKRFFDELDESSFALVNNDDRNGKVMVQNCRARKFTYSLKSPSDYKVKVLENRFEGMLLKIDGDELSTRFIGEFNAYNLLAVYSAALLLGFDRQEVMVALSDLHPVAGRLEVIRSAEGTTAIVDYAHTPDALENVISTINRIRIPGMNLVTVVGAGGDRDRAKRPVMAGICARGSDRLILTSDNPRSEDPGAIIDEMMEGIDPAGRKKVLKITDRREAIRTAAMLAGNADIILVAGKGHETYQEISGRRSHFDDREELRKIFGLI